MDNLSTEDELFGQQPQQYNTQNEWSSLFPAFESQNGTEGARVEPVVDVIPARSSAKQVRQKKVSRRGGAFTQDEDKIICSAFLNINKGRRGYYKRIHKYFCKHKPEGSSRSQIAIQHRWQVIQKGVNRFCLFKSAADKRNESGKCEQDRIEDAVKMYEKKKSFTFMHCWKLLCNEAKWNDHMLKLNRPSPSMKSVPTSQDSSDNCNDRVDRLEGCYIAKKRRSNEGDAAWSNNTVDVLQQIHERNEKTEEKKEQQMQEILTLKGGKRKLSEKMYDPQKEDMEKRSRSEEQHLILTKDIEVRAKQSEVQLLTVELDIMRADLDKLAPTARAYYITMQRQIMERRARFSKSSD